MCLWTDRLDRLKFWQWKETNTRYFLEAHRFIQKSGKIGQAQSSVLWSLPHQSERGGKKGVRQVGTEPRDKQSNQGWPNHEEFATIPKFLQPTLLWNVGGFEKQFSNETKFKPCSICRGVLGHSKTIQCLTWSHMGRLGAALLVWVVKVLWVNGQAWGLFAEC